MGMFDTIEFIDDIKLECPSGHIFRQDSQFQTKQLDKALDYYYIHNGLLYKHQLIKNPPSSLPAIRVDALIGDVLHYSHPSTAKLRKYTGSFVAYDECRVCQVWCDFQFTFKKGMLVDVVLIEESEI